MFSSQPQQTIEEICLTTLEAKHQERNRSENSLMVYKNNEYQTQQQNIKEYFAYLDELKEFKPELLNYLNTEKAFFDAMNGELWIDCKINLAQLAPGYDNIPTSAPKFLALLKSLVELKRILPTDEESIYHTPLRQVLTDALQMTEIMVKDRDMFNKKRVTIEENNRKIDALQQTIHYTVATVSNPGLIDLPPKLEIANEHMRKTINPHFSYHEKQLWICLSSVITTILAISVIAAFALSNPASAALGYAAGASAGVLPFSIGLALFSFWPAPTRQQSLAESIYHQTKSCFFSQKPAPEPDTSAATYTRSYLGMTVSS